MGGRSAPIEQTHENQNDDDHKDQVGAAVVAEVEVRQVDGAKEAEEPEDDQDDEQGLKHAAAFFGLRGTALGHPRALVLPHLFFAVRKLHQSYQIVMVELAGIEPASED